jgi:hypothetical protein
MEQYLSYYSDNGLMTKEALIGTFQNMSVQDWKSLVRL